MNPAFWKNKRVLITGHTGFKGAWLSIWLRHLGSSVTGYALEPPTKPSLFEMANVVEGIESHIADVRDLKTLSKIVGEGNFDAIFHLAAQPLVLDSYDQPVETYSTNVMGTVNLLEAVRLSASSPAVVIVTTDKCYENHEQPEPYREDEPMGGHDPYSSSKGCCELVTSAYRRSFFSNDDIANPGPRIASGRAGNVIGGGDWAKNRLLPDCMRAFSAGQAVTLRCPGAVRPWQHVLEPLGGYLLLAQRLKEPQGQRFAQGWNFGPDKSDIQSVGKVAEKLAELWADGACCKFENENQKQLHEANLLMLDCTKAKEQLNWRVRVELNLALQWTANWYKKVNDGQNALDLCVEQIDAFMAME